MALGSPLWPESTQWGAKDVLVKGVGGQGHNGQGVRIRAVEGAGTPNRSSTTLIMYLNNFLKTSKNYGMAGAVSVIIFIITGLLSILVFKSLTKDDN